MIDNKPLPFPEPILSDANKKKMEEIKKSVGRAQVISEFAEIKRMEPIYEARRQFTKTIPKFWAIAFLRHAGFAQDLKNAEDIRALQFLTDVSIKRNPVEPRVYTLEFAFSNNPYFEDRVLNKVYQFTESQARKKERADHEGFKWAMLDFDWENDVKALPNRIVWKSGKNLCTKYPKKVDPDDGEVTELGSFFNWFESDGDEFDIGLIISEEIFPDAIKYFNGEVEDGEDEDDEGEEDSDCGNSDGGKNKNYRASYKYGPNRVAKKDDEDDDTEESDDGKNKNYNTSYKSGLSRVVNKEDEDDDSEDDDNNDYSPSHNLGRNSVYNRGARGR